MNFRGWRGFFLYALRPRLTRPRWTRHWNDSIRGGTLQVFGLGAGYIFLVVPKPSPILQAALDEAERLLA